MLSNKEEDSRILLKELESKLAHATLKINQQKLELEEKQKQIDAFKSKDIPLEKSNVQNEPSLEYQLFDFMDEGFSHGRIIADENGTPTDWIYLKVNKGFEKHTGIKSSNVTGKHFKSIFPEVDKDPTDWIGKFGETAITGKPQSFEAEFTPLGRYYMVNLFCPAQGEFACIFSNITPFKENEAIFKRTEKVAELGSWEWDIENDKVKWSDNLFEIFKLDKNNGEPSFHGDHKKLYTKKSMALLISVVEGAVKNGTPYEVDLEFIKSNGEKGFCIARGIAKRDGKGEVVKLFGSFQDITERKKIEFELRNSKLELEKLNQTKDKLFNIIAHDLKNPVGSILSLTNFIKDSDNKNEQAIELLQKASFNLHDLVESLLSWARIQSSMLEFTPFVTNAKSLVNKNIALVQSLSEKKQIGLFNKVPDNLRVFTDLNTTGIVLRNLLTNAIKFTPNKGAVEVYAKELADMIEIGVQDNGIGMPQNIIDNLFVINERNNSRRGTENEQGTGLGLIICKEIIERQGGTLNVESEEGKGSKFYFDLPKEGMAD